MKIYMIIPAHNEAVYLPLTLQSITHQSLLPEKVVVVNDHSTDNTEAIIDTFVNDYPFFEKLNTISSSHHLPGSKVIHAFHKGQKILDDNFDVIIKLDADIVLPTCYLATIAAIFKRYPKVGIAGGFAYEKNKQNVWALHHPMHKNHVRGAFKAYTKACFTAIGGLKASIGWDTVDELLAIYYGYEIHTDDRLKVKHLRPTGKSYHSNAALMQGEALYKMRYGFWLAAIASAKMAWKQRRLGILLNNLKGYQSAKRTKASFLVNEAEGIFIRRYRYRGIRKRFFK